MNILTIREPEAQDESQFLQVMLHSRALHEPWVKAPLTAEEFSAYLTRSQLPNQKSYIAFAAEKIVGVFNLSEIVRGGFQNAYLGFYANIEKAGSGYMSKALKLVLQKAFSELGLHRVEANIQPENISSIHLVQSNGFRKEGFSPHYLKIGEKWCDHERWAITVEDFQPSEDRNI